MFSSFKRRTAETLFRTLASLCGGFKPLQLVDISKLGSNSKIIKKFSYSFICGKGYSPPKGENSFLSTVCGGFKPPIGFTL